MTTKNPCWTCLRRFVSVAVALLATVAVSKTHADEPEVRVVHVLATDAWASEFLQDGATFTVYRTGPTNDPLAVPYRLEGTASNGEDYEELSGSVTFDAGAATALIRVEPFEDTRIEGNETVALILEAPVVDVFPPPYVVGWPGDAVAYIEDNDFPPTNQPPAVRIANPPDGSVFESPVDIRLIAQATDSDGRVLTVEFFDGSTSLGVVSNQPPIIRPIPLAADVLELSIETDPLLYPDLDVILDPSIIRPSVFLLSWPNVPPGDHVLTAVATDNLGGSSTSEPVEIKVTEPAPPVIVNVRAMDPVASEPGPTRSRLDTATFTIGRTGPTDLPLTVYYRLSGDARNGVDYRELPYSVVIPRGATRTEVVIEPLDDNLVEGPEKVVLTVVPPVCIAIYPPPPDCYQVGKLDSARAVINDNDPANLPPVVEIVRPLDGSVYLAPVDIAIIAQARDFDGRVVTVEFFEGTNSLGVISNRPSLLTARTPQFALKWPDVKPGHYILSAEATDDDGAKSESRPVEIKVVERTLPPVVSVEATDPEAAEPGANGVVNTATFTFKRTGPTDRALTVFYSVGGTAENGVDYREIGTRVLIPPGASTAPVVVQPVDDRLVEGTESVSVTIEPAPLLSASILPIDYYLIGSNNLARAVIRDNDVTLSNQPPKVALTHPANGNIFAAPADIGLVAEARDVDGYVRTVEFFEGERSLGVVSNSIGVAANILPMPEQFFRLSWPNVRAGSYVLTARATDNRGATSVSEPIRIRVIEESRQPVVTIEATDPFASEGDWILEPIPLDPLTPDRVAFIGPPIIIRPDIATFTVKRDRGTNIPLTVYYSLSGTAENGIDYRRLDRSVVIPAGAWSASIVVLPLDDQLVEGTETIIASLDPIACIAIYPPPPDCYLIGEPAKAVAYIRDNDFANQPPRVEITKPEPGARFLSPVDIEIVARVRDPDGYVTAVEFFAGTNSIGKESRVYIIAPPPGQVDTFSIIWSNAPVDVHLLTAVATDDQGLSSHSEPVRIEVHRLLLPRQVTIRATDPWASEGLLLDPWPIDPIVPIDVALAANVIMDPIGPNPPVRPIIIGPNNAVFTVSRNCCTNEDWVVSYKLGGTAENGVDYESLSGVVRIIRGNWSAPIIVEPIDDLIYEGTETVECSLADPCSDPRALWPYPCYEIGDPGKALAWIRDNDKSDNVPPRVAIVKPETGDQFRKGADIPIVVQTVDEDGWVGRMEFFADGRSIGDQAIYFIIPPPPGQLQRFSMIWSNAPAGRHVLTAIATDDQGLKGGSRPVVIEVIESPVIPVVNIVATDGFAREGSTPNTASFRIRRSGETNVPLTVHFAIEGTAKNGADYVEIPASVTIPAGQRAAGVIVTPIDDRLVERIETVILRLQNAALYNVGRWSAAGAIIVDNDHPSPGPICLPDRTFHARLKGANGQCYRLEISDDLKQWEALDPCVVLDDAVHFLDCEAPGAKARFYRAIPVSDVEIFSEE